MQGDHLIALQSIIVCSGRGVSLLHTVVVGVAAKLKH